MLGKPNEALHGAAKDRRYPRYADLRANVAVARWSVRRLPRDAPPACASAVTQPRSRHNSRMVVKASYLELLIGGFLTDSGLLWLCLSMGASACTPSGIHFTHTSPAEVV